MRRIIISRRGSTETTSQRMPHRLRMMTTNDNRKYTARYVNGDTITSVLATLALWKACNGLTDFTITIAGVLITVIIYGVFVGLYRFWRPNLKGCGAALEVGSQWTLFCGEQPPGHPNNALCKSCDPRTGTPRKE